jgi:hypothetical protein
MTPGNSLGSIPTNSSEATERRALLDSELTVWRDKERSLARSGYLWSQGLFILALLCSVGAAVAGLFFNLPGHTVGGIAALPPLIAFIATNLKLEARSDWHYRKSYLFDTLHSRLMYQLPAAPTVDNIAAIAHDRDTMVDQMEAEWKKTSAISWTEMLRERRDLIAKPPTPKAQ